MTLGIEVVAQVRGAGDGHGGDDVSRGSADSDGDPNVDVAIVDDVDGGDCAAVGVGVGAAAAPDDTPPAPLHSYPQANRTPLRSAHRSGSGELEKRLDVAIIRRSDRLQISRACFAFFYQIGGTPRKCRTAELHCEYVCD